MNDLRRRLLLDRLGVDPARLLSPTPTSGRSHRGRLPTDPDRRCARRGPHHLPALLAPRRPTLARSTLDRIIATDVGALAEHVRAHAVNRPNTRDGRCAAENAIADGHLRDNPAVHIAKPGRLASTRTALTARQLRAIHQIAATTGNDPALDTLLLRLHTETACRRGGALALRPCDLDASHCLIRLREKGGTLRWQSVSPALMHHLQHGQLLRYANGRPITRRRYDQPDHVALVGDAKQDLSAVPADLRPLFTDPTVRRTVAFDAQYPLTRTPSGPAPAVRDISGSSKLTGQGWLRLAPPVTHRSQI